MEEWGAAAGGAEEGEEGVFGVGVYNGQTANRAEQNDNLHVAARLSYPFHIGKQIIEPGIQAYAGKYVLPADIRSAGVKALQSFEFIDRRGVPNIYQAFVINLPEIIF